MVRILIDANVFIDVVTKRRGWRQSSEVLSSSRNAPSIQGWYSAGTRMILYHFIRKSADEASTRDHVRRLLKHLSPIPLRAGVLARADKDAGDDFEDNVQIASALQFGLDAVVTRNKKHFDSGRIDVFTPEEFIEAHRRDAGKVDQVPFIDLSAQHHRIYNPIDEGLTDVIQSSSFILGSGVERFEEEFAAFCGVRYAVGVGCGLDALQFALTACGVSDGDEVIVPANTFIATALAVSAVGAKPVLVDIDPDTYNTDVRQVEGVLTKRTKAMLPVHLYGQPVDMDPLSEIGKEYNIPVIEDACQAHGAEYKGRRVGSMGRAACFSFYPGKNLGAYGDGDMVVTEDEEVRHRIRWLRDYGQSAKYHHDVKGVNSRLDSIQAAVLRVKLKYLEEWNESRRAHAGLYNQSLAGVDHLITPTEASFARHVYHLYVVRVKARPELQKALSDKGIATGIHYPIPIHLQKAYSDLGYKKGDFPVTETYADEVLSLPMFPELSDEQIHYVVRSLRESL